MAFPAGLQGPQEPGATATALWARPSQRPWGRPSLRPWGPCAPAPPRIPARSGRGGAPRAPASPPSAPHELSRQRQALLLQLSSLRGALAGRAARTERGRARAAAPGPRGQTRVGLGRAEGLSGRRGPRTFPLAVQGMHYRGRCLLQVLGGRSPWTPALKSSRPDPTWSKHHDRVVAHADQSRKAATSPGDTPGGVLCLSPYHATAARAGVPTRPGISGLEHPSF